MLNTKYILITNVIINVINQKPIFQHQPNIVVDNQIISRF